MRAGQHECEAPLSLQGHSPASSTACSGRTDGWWMDDGQVNRKRLQMTDLARPRSRACRLAAWPGLCLLGAPRRWGPGGHASSGAPDSSDLRRQAGPELTSSLAEPVSLGSLSWAGPRPAPQPQGTAQSPENPPPPAQCQPWAHLPALPSVLWDPEPASCPQTGKACAQVSPSAPPSAHCPGTHLPGSHGVWTPGTVQRWSPQAPQLPTSLTRPCQATGGPEP